MSGKIPSSQIVNAKPPTISVIMPVYNGEKYLREAIDSILAQTYSDFELIMIDDGSKDGSLRILREYEQRDPRVRVISRENRGVPITLNEAIDIARGKFIARMDQDDISHPERFEQQVALMEAEGADICGCHWLVMNPEGKTIASNITPLTQESFVAYLSYTVPFAHGSVMMRKSFLTENSLEYDRVKVAEDYDLWVRMFEANAKFVNVDEFLFKYRDAPATLSKLKHVEIASDTQKLRRRFVRSNVAACKNAVQHLALNFSGLGMIEQIYVLYLSWHVSLVSKQPICISIFAKARWQLKIYGLIRILRG